jgi:hypothetical protein
MATDHPGLFYLESIDPEYEYFMQFLSVKIDFKTLMRFVTDCNTLEKITIWKETKPSLEVVWDEWFKVEKETHIKNLKK